MVGALVLWRWTFCFNFKGPPSWILQKNVLPLLEPKLLVIWKRIGKATKLLYGVWQFAETWY
jgi:hypothetical protein